VTHKLLLPLALLLIAAEARADRLKDLADLRGARPNKLFGYGLVVGLAGTGDDITAEFTVQSVVTMLRRLGVQVDGERLRLKNVAAVVVTAELPAFAAAGRRIDVTVSSIGNARSLQGGTLLATPLRGADLQVYAMAQGALSVGGYLAGGRTGSQTQKNHTTVARIPNGALVEREVTVELAREQLEINLREPDFTTAVRVADVIRGRLDAIAAAASEVGTPPSESEEEGGAEEGGTDSLEVTARDPGTVVVHLPHRLRERVTLIMAELEKLEVDPDRRARVVVNERTGTVVLGSGVRLLPVAIAHGGLTVQVKETLLPSQPGPLSRGTTRVVPDTRLDIAEGTGSLRELAGASLSDVVRALNAIGVKPRDLVAILQALKSAGSLRAELEVQ
jgi:flagellar P-ring protein precursor FlgI